MPTQQLRHTYLQCGAGDEPEGPAGPAPAL